MTRILGISAYYHDSAATLVVDGRLIAAAQEERFSRVKHDPGFPVQAIEYCLQQGDCRLEQLDAVIFYDKPLLKFERLLETYLAHAPTGFLSFLRAMPIWLKEKLYLKSVLRRELRSIIATQRQNQAGVDRQNPPNQQQKPRLPQLLFSEHHQSHAASAFFPSPFERAVVLCLDGVGEWATSSIWLGQGNSLTPLKEIQFPHSLGLLYSAFTSYCGFKVNSGEYKLMGLAPYGQPTYVDTILTHLVQMHADGSFALNMQYFDYPAGERMTNRAFARLFDGPANEQDGPLLQKHMDLARSIQVVTEQIVLKMAQYAYQQTGVENLCLAGGVALNCVANGRLLRESQFKHLWVQPAAGDAGGSLGAALLAWHQFFEAPRNRDQSETAAAMRAARDDMCGGYLGPEFTQTQIQATLAQRALPYQQVSESALFDLVAKLLAEGNVVGWFQGRMEFGPRALGNRSILGDPRNPAMQQQMNLKIKQRESFRPFAPAVLAEQVREYFAIDTPSPYMLMVAEVQADLRLPDDQPHAQGMDKLKQLRSRLPAITHVDYSARVQTVHASTNPRFHRLLSAFAELTGTPVLINTSFNVRGEPPVCNPEQAIRGFLATEMDVLVMGNCVLHKSAQRQQDIERARAITFAKD